MALAKHLLTFRRKPSAISGLTGSKWSPELSQEWLSYLHAFVIWTAAAFGDDPGNDLIGIGDIARLAVNAIRKIDFQFLAGAVFDHFVDGGGAKILAGIAVFFDALCCANVQVSDVEMAGLIFLVARAGVIDVGEAVEGEFAVAGKARDGGSAVDFFVGFVAGVRGHGIDEAASAGDLLEGRVEKAGELAVSEALMKITDLPQFFFDVAGFDFGLVGAEGFCGRVAGFERVECGFGGEHAALHGKVNAF